MPVRCRAEGFVLSFNYPVGLAALRVEAVELAVVAVRDPELAVDERRARRRALGAAKGACRLVLFKRPEDDLPVELSPRCQQPQARLGRRDIPDFVVVSELRIRFSGCRIVRRHQTMLRHGEPKQTAVVMHPGYGDIAQLKRHDQLSYGNSIFGSSRAASNSNP